MAVESTAVSLIERASVALGAAEHEKRLVELAKTSVGITSITNAAGYQECHSVRMSLKKARIEIEKTGKAARGDAVAFLKAVIAEERRLIGIIEPEETRLQTIQDAHDAKAEAERQAKAKAEEARITAIQERIDWMLGQPAEAIGLSAAAVKVMLDELVAAPVTPALYAEFITRAEAVKAASVAKLSAMHGAAVANEVEAARLKAEREEFARQKAEQEAAAAAERARLAEEARVAKARQEEEEHAAKAKRDAEAAAERKRLDEEARIAREARDAADAKARAEREAADKAAREERAKEAAAQAEIDAKARAEREAEDRRLTAERAALATREQAAREEEARQQQERDRVAREAKIREEAEARRKVEEEARLSHLRAVQSAREEYSTPERAFVAILAICQSEDLSDADARDAIALIAEAYALEKVAA